MGRPRPGFSWVDWAGGQYDQGFPFLILIIQVNNALWVKRKDGSHQVTSIQILPQMKPTLTCSQSHENWKYSR